MVEDIYARILKKDSTCRNIILSSENCLATPEKYSVFAIQFCDGYTRPLVEHKCFRLTIYEVVNDRSETDSLVPFDKAWWY